MDNYVTKEEFLELKNRFNELLSTLESAELKRRVSFDELYLEDYTDSEDNLTDEIVENEEKF
jgi:hypothetical protein